MSPLLKSDINEQREVSKSNLITSDSAHTSIYTVKLAVKKSTFLTTGLTLKKVFDNRGR